MTTLVEVSLQENGSAQDVRGLGDETAAALRRTGLVDAVALARDTWRITPLPNYVGSVSTPGVTVTVRPKVGIARLLFLLGYAKRPGFRPEDVAGQSEDDLWPALAETLARRLESALARGILQGYSVREEALPLVRGRVRFEDQLRRRGTFPLPIEVRYDEYSVDIPENQLLRAAASRMSNVPRIPGATRNRLRHLDARLAEARRLTAGAARPKWQMSRLNERYHSALWLSELVLDHHSLEPGPVGQPMASFVVNMGAVFEQFLSTALKEAWLTHAGETIAQYPCALDEARRVAMRADVVHVHAGRPAIVVDAKYKREELSGYPNADHYQMLAYCTALQLRTGWLVYAEGSKPHEILVSHTDKRIVEYPLDLGASPDVLLAQVERLAERAWSTLTPRHL